MTEEKIWVSPTRLKKKKEKEVKIMSKFNKKSLGSVILNYKKSANDELMDNNYEIDEFTALINVESGEQMIAFTVKEKPEQYFWASTGLYNFLADNIDIAINNEDRLTYTFEEKVYIKYGGKKTLKSDKNKQCNIWKINF